MPLLRGESPGLSRKMVPNFKSLQGFQDDLGINDTDFATIISILFAGFILFQVPSNMIMVSEPVRKLL